MPTKDRRQVVAATAEAAYVEKESTIYVWLPRNMLTIPNPNGMSARIGTILLFDSVSLLWLWCMWNELLLTSVYVCPLSIHI